MKRIVDGKRYNTEKAARIAVWSNGLGDSDINSVDETLYRTRAGAFFLHGSGGANTGYAQDCGNNSRSGGSAIIPMDEDETYEWLEGRGLTEEIEQFFPDRFIDA